MKFNRPEFETSQPRRQWKSMGLSFLAHLLIILLAFFIVKWLPERPNRFADEPGRRVDVVLAVVNESAKTEFENESAADNSNEQSPATTPMSATRAPAPSINTPVQPELAGIVPNELATDANQMTRVPSNGVQSTEFTLTEEDLKFIAKEQQLVRSRRPKGKPTSISVFGSGQMQGRSFVFVLDRSQSMGAGGLGVIRQAQSELAKAVGKLEENHWFQIVAYHDRTSTLLRREMLRANRANKSVLPEFIGNLAAFGGTSHENGLVAALAFKPDSIILLTDGGLPALHNGQLKAILRMAGNQRGRGTEIHCIQFGSGPLQQETNFMKELAKQNHGSYRYINVNAWSR